MTKIFSILFISMLCISGCKKDGTSTSTSNINQSTISNQTSTSSINETSSSSIATNSSFSSISSSSNSPSSSSGYVEVNKFELSTPSLNLNVENGVVTWGAIEEAEYYNYVINDGEIMTTTSTTLELEDKSNVSIQAMGDNKYSNWSNAVTYYDTSDVTLEGSNALYNVYFHDANMDKIQVRHGEKLNRPIDPTKINYIFENWYEDPFYTTPFDFDQPITKSLVIYAHYVPTDFVDNVYYWIKANSKMSADNQSSFTSDSGWRFIPLKESTTSSLKEFTAVVTVSNASTTSPCQFLVMDGIDDEFGRTYYKNGDSDFKITENGTYRITFSVETLYLVNGNQVNAKYEKITNSSLNYANNFEVIQLTTPVVDVDGDNNIAFISEVKDADGYEVIINNGISKIITNNQVILNKGEHISVRAVKDNSIYSNWSIPKANINYIYEDDIDTRTHAYVYFYELNEDAQLVELNTYIQEVKLTKEGYNFLGWYLDLAKTKLATFPYLVTENTVFYPKWEAVNELLTKEYYEFIDSSGQKISGLTLNIDNYDFYEYKTPSVTLEANENYYIKSLTTSEIWGPYSVEESGSYTIYFSEEYIWNVNTENAKNVYFALDVANIYFTNALKWSGTIYAYYWNSASGDWYKSWPGSIMEYVKTNSYGQDIYKVSLDLSKYDYIIFNNSSLQTVDLSLSGAKNNDAFYTKDEKDGTKYKCGTYTFS